MTKLTRTCADCSTDISDRHGRAVYCNPCVIAREKARNARQRPRSKRICEHCGETFETRHQPGHVWENLAAAHLRCNISKGPRATGRDWKLYTELKSLREGATTWPPKRQALAQPPLFDAYSTTGLTAKAQPSSCPALPEPSPDAKPH